jgi:hypothetical protein
VLNGGRVGGTTKGAAIQTSSTSYLEQQQRASQRFSVRRGAASPSVAPKSGTSSSAAADDIDLSQPGFHSRMFEDLELPLPTGVEATMDRAGVVTTVLGALCHVGRGAIGPSAAHVKGSTRQHPGAAVEPPTGRACVSVAGAAPFPLSLLVRLGLRLVADCVVR